MADEEKKVEETKTPKSVKGRVLVDHAEHKCNTVITLGAAEAKDAEAAGWLDTNPKAVAAGEKMAEEVAELEAFNAKARGEAKK